MQDPSCDQQRESEAQTPKLLTPIRLLCNTPFYFSPFHSYDPVTGRLHETQTTPFPLYNDCVTVERPDVKSVWAYTNGDEVELFLNGESQGRQAVAPFDKGTWILSFDPGERYCLLV
jgi:hypothetical protein